MYPKVSLNGLRNIKKYFPKLDNKGGLLIPTSFKIKDFEFRKYRHLPVNWEIGAVTSEFLPDEFSPKTVKLIDIFRRKTINLDFEIMLVFDYTTAEIIYCFVNDGSKSNEVKGDVDDEILGGRNIAVIHNHPSEFGSPPSSNNFQILNLTFQDYEIVSSWDGIWVLESKELIPLNEVNKIKQAIQDLNDYSCEFSQANHEDEKSF